MHSKAPNTAIITVNYKTPWHIQKCLNSVFKHTSDFHLILVQNSPDSKSVKVVNSFKQRYPGQITVITNSKNLGYVGGVNSAHKEAMKYRRFCLLNSDTVVTAGWLGELNKVLDQHRDVVQVAPDSNAYYPESLKWKLVRQLPFGLSKLYGLKMRSEVRSRRGNRGGGFVEYERFYDFPAGLCNLTYSKFFQKLGYIHDPNIIHGYWDDFDMATYLRQFGKVGYVQSSYVFHYINASFNKVLTERAKLKNKLMTLNGFYVMHKWHEKIRKEVSKMTNTDLVATQQVHVMQMVLAYLGIMSVQPEFAKYIEGIPARSIGEQFLK